MLISHSWLKKYIPTLDELSPETISNALTGTLAEVEKYVSVRGELSKIVCGEVLDAKPLEGTAKLSVCLVDIGDSKSTIICGAPNVMTGQKVAVCLPGGKVYDAHSKNPNDTMEIKEKALMGVTSQGMICSGKELNLVNEHEGILVLEPEMKVGTDLIPILKDIVYEIENKSLSHRPDCFGHAGIARELAAILNLEYIDNEPEPTFSFTKQLPFELDVKVDGKLCPRFTCVLVTDITVKQSPLWLISKLTAVDVRSVNNVVDITNYIMFDKGQPLHAYDYDKLKGNKLVVRMAKDGEDFSALNKKKYKLTKENIVVCDGEKIEDLAGIMGGAGSEINDKTKTVLLEAANWNMYSIRRTSRQHGLRSEASTRFEKGQDPTNSIVGLKTALGLILDLTNSEIASELTDYYPEPRQIRQVTFNVLSVKRFLGIDLTRQEIIDTFKRLRLEVVEKEKTSDELEIVIPTYRGDLNMEADLLEEIARLYGYAKIQPTLPTRSLTAANTNAYSIFVRKVNETLVRLGFDEVLTYSFVDPKLLSQLGLSSKECLALENPLSPELSLIRNTLIPSLLATIKSNIKKYNSIKIFEINRTIQEKLDKSGIHIQPNHLGLMTYGKKSRNAYLELKGVLETLLLELGCEFSIEPSDQKTNYLAPIMHKNRCADLLVNGQNIGSISELKPSVESSFGLEGRVVYTEIDLDLLLTLYKKEKTYHRLSVYPSVFRDLSFWMAANITYQQLTSTIKKLDLKTIKKISFIDQFTNPDKQNTKSITIRLEIQDDARTLTDKEIEPITTSIVGTVTKELKASLRDSSAK